jgi:hypothetical protein
MKKEWNPHSLNQLAMERAKVGSREARSYNPNSLVGHHDRARHKAIPMAPSDAVVIARSKKCQGGSGKAYKAVRINK